MKLSLTLISLVLFLCSCAQQSDVKLQGRAAATTFISLGAKPVDIRWWHNFSSDELTNLIEQGLSDNLSLKAHQLRLKSSALGLKIAGASLYPDLDLTSRATTDFDDIGEIKSTSFGFKSTWEIDFWGRIAASEQKAYWDHQGQQALYRARANLVAGSISNAWLSLVSEYDKKQVLANQFHRTQTSLKAILRRFALGKNSVTNIWQQEKLLKSIAVQQAKNNANIFTHQQTLALWLGITTDKLASFAINLLPALPDLPNMGLPAQVLKYRPDIEQAFAKIKAADEHLAIAISEQYPRITLSANYSSTGVDLSDLFNDWSGNLVAALAMPIFDAGTRKSLVEQRKLLLSALIADYEQVWLEAIVSVNQVLNNEKQLLQVVSNLSLQLELAQRTEKLTRIKYLNGKTNYLNLLQAQESILTLERQFIDANKNVMKNRVLLYRELSHGDFSFTKKTIISSYPS